MEVAFDREQATKKKAGEAFITIRFNIDIQYQSIIHANGNIRIHFSIAFSVVIVDRFKIKLNKKKENKNTNY